MISNPKDLIILVSGATGQQGGAVVRNLLKRGFKVRALTRNKNGMAAKMLEGLGTEVVEGDFANPDSLKMALAGVYGAYSVQNSWVVGTEGEIKQGKAFADAAKKAGIQHFVYSSVEGADRNTGIPFFDSKWTLENHIRNVDLPYTIIRPVAFMNNWLGAAQEIRKGKLIFPLSASTKFQQVAVDDIGYFVALAFAEPGRFMDRSIPLAGDELTLPEMALRFTKVLGKDVAYEQIPWDQYRQKTGGYNTLMTAWFEEKGYQANINTLRKINPALKTFETFVKEHKSLFQ